MAEYIERGMVLELLKDVDRYGYLDASDINSIPAADVAPVRHGRWEKADNLKPKCSVCGEFRLYSWADHKTCNYCPNCGALMDLEGGNT